MFLEKRHQKYKKIFKFEFMWLKDKRCEKIVTEVWEEGLCMASAFPILSCMESCRNKLEVWNTNDYGHVGKKIASLQKHLEWLEVQESSLDVIKELRETRVELNCWLDKEDAIWKQRAWLNWFQAGD